MSEIEAKENLEMLENAYRVSKKGSAVYEALIEFVTLEDVAEAIQAIEKQVPKKPIFANNMMTKDKFLMCPCYEFRLPDSLVFLKTRCWNCRQKLDWSDEE